MKGKQYNWNSIVTTLNGVKIDLPENVWLEGAKLSEYEKKLIIEDLKTIELSSDLQKDFIKTESKTK